MKKKNMLLFFIVFATISFTLAGCSDFLNMTPKGKRVVKTVEDHRDIMASYMYFIKNVNRNQIKLFGVDEYAYPLFNMNDIAGIYTGENLLFTRYSHVFDKDKNAYTDYAVRLLTWQSPNDEVWNRYYRFLGPINVLITEIEKAECSDINTKNYVKGEATVWRAYAYYKLLQYYSPYKNNEYGIPMYLTPAEDIGTVMPKRETQSTTFQQIISDCNGALELLKQTPSTDWNFAYNEDFIHAMMASIYLWKSGSGAAEKDDLANAHAHAVSAIGHRQLAQNEDELKKIFDCSKSAILTSVNSPEFYIRITDNTELVINSNSYIALGSSSVTSGEASPDYYKLFTDNDLRKNFYFRKDELLTMLGYDVFSNNKYNLDEYTQSYSSAGCYMPFRLAEMYLIKAETEFRMNRKEEAKATLDIFRKSRYTDGGVTANTPDLLSAILSEREKEFYIENDFNWLDYKRLGRTIKRTVNNQEYTLEPNDFRYSFPIPQKEMQENHNMKQNPGWENYYQ